MTVFPYQIAEVHHLYNRLAKLKPSPAQERDRSEPQDVVHISAEAKRRQVLDQAKAGVLEQTRTTR